MKFYMQNCVGDTAHFDSENMVDAIHTAWNIEAELYLVCNVNWLVFSPFDDNEFNNELLEEYGLRIIDHGGYRKVQNIATGEIYDAPWESETK